MQHYHLLCQKIVARHVYLHQMHFDYIDPSAMHGKRIPKEKREITFGREKIFFFPNEKVFAFSQNVFFVKNAINAEKQTSFLFKNLILPN